MDEKAVLSGKKILIVDDEPDVLETLEEMLDICLIDKAPNFETAQRFLSKNTYDAAILDIMGVRGYDLLKLATGKNIPALMLTAHALSPENLVRSIRGGAMSYVPKDKIGEIGTYLAEVITAHQGGAEKKGRWFTRLKPFFDRKFGPGWREKDKAFWDDFERTFRVSKEDVSDIL
jgi:DNA-binding NtrC family response regulator